MGRESLIIAACDAVVFLGLLLAGMAGAKRSSQARGIFGSPHRWVVVLGAGLVTLVFSVFLQVVIESW